MPNITLSDSRIRALEPRSSAYDLRDPRLKGFGVRVLPSGAKRFFLHAQHCGERVWQIVGDANALSLAEARARAASRLAAIRRGDEAPPGPQDARFEAVAAAVFARHASVWKPRTLEVNRSYLHRQILPGFRGRPVAEITAQDVRRWFASLRATPVAADRSLPVLSVIMREAELMGARPEGTNPCRGIRRYRRKGRERFLTDEEIARLAARLSAHAVERPLEVAAVRLLMLTGCRKSEVATLRWSDYREGHLFLRDSKTGPRTVWLSHAARAVLESVPRTRSWVFPFPGRNAPPRRHWPQRFWQRVRAEAGLPGVRLHDLRHSYASFALRRGESVLAIGRLLGHADAQTTLKYTHLADAMVHEAAETVGAVVEG